MKTIVKYYLRVTMFLLPVMFFPAVTESFGFGRQWLWGSLGLIGLVLWMVAMVVEKKNDFKINGWWMWMVALVVWTGVSWLRLQPGLRMNAALSYFGVVPIIGLALWSFLWMQQDEEEREIEMNYLTAAGLVTVVISLILFLIPSSKLPIVFPKNNPLVSIGEGWSLTGSLATEIVFLGFLVMEWLRRLLKKVNGGSYIGEAAVMALLALVLLLDVYRLNKIGWTKLDTNSGWVVAAESFKNSPVWGVGVGNFANAFGWWRPAAYNMTKFWSSGFKLSSMTGLQIWTELGLGGLIVMAAMVWLVIKNRKKDYGWVRMAIFLVVVMLMPFDLVGWMLLGWLMVSNVLPKRGVEMKFRVGEKRVNIGPGLAMAGMLVLVVGAGYWWTRIMLGEIYLRQSLVAAAKNNGGDTYNLQIKAIGMNPYAAEYRRIYSQTNLALAMSILNNKDVSDDDKQKASVLVQQSVREAKAAVSLDSQNGLYWSNLAAIYRQLVGLIDGTADWSYQAYSQAVVLDPVNVLNRLDLGGLLFAAGRYDEAERMFEQVVLNKQDYANGWYNWAYSGYKMGKLGDAVQRMTQAVSLVSVDSGDYEKASKELDGWKKEYDAAVAKQKLQQEQAKAPETLKTSDPLPTGTQKEKVAVPKDELAPPETTPMITPTETVTPTPKI